MNHREQSSVKRYALLVGIDDYTSMRPESEEPAGRTVWTNLTGAVNDAKAMAAMLIARYGFMCEGVRLLTNHGATRERILEEITDHLISPVREGDEVFFYFAGHGSQVVNSLSDEPDKKDETIVPVDAILGTGDIRDKELRALFNQSLDRRARLTVVLDSCHSGSGIRGLPGRAGVRALALDPRDVADGNQTGPRPEDRGALVFSAAQDFQKAWETWDEAGQSHGAFSLALLRAMRTSGIHESAQRLFLRARGHLQAERSYQEPVLAGVRERRSAPLFGGRADHRADKTVVAVEKVVEEGSIFLQGGWANGLSEGSELVGVEDETQRPRARIRVTHLEHLARARAEILAESPQDAEIRTGDLFALEHWAVPEAASLNVRIPETGWGCDELLRWSQELESLARGSDVAWIRDPVAESPTHVVGWEREGWHLLVPGDPELSCGLGARPSAHQVIESLAAMPPPIKLFVHLPAPEELAGRLELGADTRNNAVERTSVPARANYSLAGRSHQGRLEYAWVRPNVSEDDRGSSPLPLRTDWLPLASGARREAVAWKPYAQLLTDTVLRIAKIQAWLTLHSPEGGDFPYHLALRSSDGGRLREGVLPKGGKYGLVLQAETGTPSSRVIPRYIYVFCIDSFGNSTLLFPEPNLGNVENRFPLDQGHDHPPEIPLGPQPLFRVGDPLGLDTFFLLTTREPISQPLVLNCKGVRDRGPKGGTPLEELLSRRGGTSRSPHLLTPTTWSIERLFFETRPRAR